MTHKYRGSIVVLLLLRESWRSPAEISPPLLPSHRRAAGGLELLLHHHLLDRGGEGVIELNVCKNSEVS